MKTNFRIIAQLSEIKNEVSFGMCFLFIFLLCTASHPVSLLYFDPSVRIYMCVCVWGGVNDITTYKDFYIGKSDWQYTPLRQSFDLVFVSDRINSLFDRKFLMNSCSLPFNSRSCRSHLILYFQVVLQAFFSKSKNTVFMYSFFINASPKKLS